METWFIDNDNLSEVSFKALELVIWLVFKSEDTLLIELFNEHYSIRTNIEQMLKCPNCLHSYESIHNCNALVMIRTN